MRFGTFHRQRATSAQLCVLGELCVRSFLTDQG